MNRPNPGNTDDDREEIDDAQLEAQMKELLALLPADLVRDLNARSIQLGNEGLLEGIVDHVSRHPALVTKNLASRLKNVRKAVQRIVRQRDPTAVVSDTVRRTNTQIGRNDKCPCGSGKKYKQCCLRKQA